MKTITSMLFKKLDDEYYSDPYNHNQKIPNDLVGKLTENVQALSYDEDGNVWCEIMLDYDKNVIQSLKNYINQIWKNI